MKNIEIKKGYYSDDTISKIKIFSRLLTRYAYIFREYSYNPTQFIIKLEELSKWGLAQSILETGEYRKILKYIIKGKEIKTKNIYNIKYGSMDLIYFNHYRIYKEYCSSVEDYIRLMTDENKKYRKILDKYFKNEIDFETCFKEISKIYAEDEKYYEKVKRIYDEIDYKASDIVEIQPCEIKIIKIGEII